MKRGWGRWKDASLDLFYESADPFALPDAATHGRKQKHRGGG